MAVSSRSFFDIAGRIHQENSGNEEIYFRTSINRAYYGAFHIVKKYLRLGRETPHSVVIRSLRRKHRYLGDLLDTLYEQRKMADYEIDVDISREDIDHSIRIAGIIIQTIEQKSR